MGTADILIRRRAILFVLVVAFAYALGLALWLTHHPHLVGMDFSIYRRAAHQTAAEAYAPRTSLPFPYMPTMLIWIAPLALIPFWPAYLGFLVISASAFAMAMRSYLTRNQTLVALATPVIVNGFSVGQCSLILAAALLWACGAPNRVKAGIVLGLIASAKPQFVILAPAMLVIRRDWRAFYAAGAAWAAMVAGSVALFGARAWQDWLTSLTTFHSILAAKVRLQMALSPALAAEFLHLPAAPFLMAGMCLGLWLLWVARRSGPLTQCAAIACASLLSAPYAMAYDLAPVIPLLIVQAWADSAIAAVTASGAFAPIALFLSAWQVVRAERETGSRQTEPISAAIPY